MSTNKTTVKAAAAPLSFVDAYGATVTIPAGEAANYAGCKAENLRVVTQLLAAAGSVGLSGSVIEDFSVIANGLANEVEALIGIIAADAANNTKGGAQ